ncbi:MAG: BMP family ABC transporter substrate-binding protein [Anaerovoracaceae bacterium]
MKKLLAVVLALVMVLGMSVSLAACGGDKESDKTKVGFLFIGSIEDKGFTQAHYEGAMKMQEELGDVEVMYKEEIADTDTQAITEATQSLLDEGCKVIVGTSFGYMDTLEKFSKEYPDDYFLHFSGYKMNDTNFANYFGAMEQPRYLAGMVAGLMTKTNKLGYVAAFDLNEVNIGINAFTLGAKSVNPKAKVNVIYINSWYNPTAEKQAAEELLGQGCDVLEQHCDTTGPQVAAETEGAFAIGYNFDNKGEAAPKAYLTAPVWNHAAYLTPTIKSIIDGTFKPESFYGNMQDGLVNLAPMTDLVPADVQDKVNAVADKMKAGEFEVFTGPIDFANGKAFAKDGQILTREDIWNPDNNGVIKGVQATTKGN